MEQFPSHSHTCMSHSLFLVFDLLGTCPTVSPVTHRDLGEAHVALIMLLYPLPAMGMYVVDLALCLWLLYTPMLRRLLRTLESIFNICWRQPHTPAIA